MPTTDSWWLDNLREWDEDAGLGLAPNIDALRPQQGEAVGWALSRPEPYLFINAPTGSGKTLINAVYGTEAGRTWTYAVHTIMLQQQVAGALTRVPVFTGRGNHPCLIGEETHRRPGVTAAEGICVERQWCPHTGVAGPDGEAPGDKCAYYQQRDDALDNVHRIANYALLLSYPPLRMYNRLRMWNPTEVLLGDEAHNIEDAVCNSAQIFVSFRTFGRFRVRVPERGVEDIGQWVEWAKRTDLPAPVSNGPPDLGLKTARDILLRMRAWNPEVEQGRWLVTRVETGIKFQPIWGRQFVMPNLFGHDIPPPTATLHERAEWRNQGVRRVLFTSATLMGAEYIAETLGLPDGSWAYLDLPSTFPAGNRPINFSPVEGMNAKKMSTAEGRANMQAAIDRVIEFYVLNNRRAGVVHAVSNKYRDFILTESRWRGIMTSTPAKHAENVANGKPSVLVAANVTEGWDGVDELCRFVIMPKVPFPDLGDVRTRVRKEEDARSYDWRALVAVVQGAGRGVRHKDDYADTWILDSNWRILLNKRKDWLPDSFRSAYHHNVELP